jgi:hypothetical protein
MSDLFFVVHHVCTDERHQTIGRDVPDREGNLHLVGGEIAYCSSARDGEPHSWRRTGGIRFADIRHADLERST